MTKTSLLRKIPQQEVGQAKKGTGAGMRRYSFQDMAFTYSSR